jgi:uncharacterized membrane protein SirB2
MDPTIYAFLHVLSAFVLVGWTYAACAAPSPERRRVTMMVTGIASFVMLVAGFGLQAKLDVGFPAWLVVKMVCWLAITAVSALAFKKPENAKSLAILVYVLAAIAIACVYFKPFSIAAP